MMTIVRGASAALTCAAIDYAVYTSTKTVRPADNIFYSLHVDPQNYAKACMYLDTRVSHVEVDDSLGSMWALVVNEADGGKLNPLLTIINFGC